eukprot:CAMPEP_0181038818 /NCGR_PEP_ID=MMETSP1070-20121207/10133_1 /TAXON_ID=265543 /ORGANISM="Minutocellus polymorphus, Strain NH13" /LENGTH=281 /DNA_ID=CAMNT_0023116617 /DNA_START=185 /DNA_END=1030 /DNA_ORIENTATION=-
MRSIIAIIIAAAITSTVEGFGPGAASSRVFLGNPQVANIDPKKPKLVLIAGCPGTGKSTFGMSVALDQGILKCISTDTIRATMRSFVASDVSPALHRSSYAPAFDGDDPVRSWKETCKVLDASVHALVDDSMDRGTSIVVEGVHVVPSRELIEKWEAAGGVAIGVLLQIQDPDTHKRLLKKRGFITGNVGAEVKKLRGYDRVRTIQDEMMKLAKESGWLRIEQRTEPDPLDMVSARLYGVDLFNPNKSGEEKRKEEAFQKAEAEIARREEASATESVNSAP